SLDEIYVNVLRDVVGALNKIVTASACQDVVRDAIIRFADAYSPGAIKVTAENVSSVLQTLHTAAEESHQTERAAQSTDRKAPSWNPRASFRFLQKVGPHLPFMIHRRDQAHAGRFAVQSGRVSMAAMRLIDPDANATLTVLTKGNPADYLIRNKRIPFV